MCSGFIAAATDTGKTVLKNQTADGLYYAVRYLSYMASATVRPEQEASPQWQPGEATRWDAGLLAGLCKRETGNLLKEGLGGPREEPYARYLSLL